MSETELTDDDLFDAAVSRSFRTGKLKDRAAADPDQSRATDQTFVLIGHDGQVLDRLPLKAVERERAQLAGMADVRLPELTTHHFRIGAGVVILLLLGYIVTQCNREAATAPPSDWLTDGNAEAACEVALKQRLRDPDSYQQAGEFVGGPGTDGTAEWRWAFRSKNGFGGMNQALAYCKADRAYKSVTTSVLE